MNFTEKEISPLASIEEWEDDLLVRYPEPKNAEKKEPNPHLTQLSHPHPHRPKPPKRGWM